MSILADNLSTQILLFEDWQSDTSGEPWSVDYLHPSAKFQELILDCRSGRKRLHYIFEAKIEKFSAFFKNEKFKNIRKIFQLPYHFKGVTDVAAFPEITEPEQMIFDFRS